MRNCLDKRVISRATAVFCLKVTSHSLTLLTSMFLANLLGASGYGVYTYAIAWTNLLSIPATLGLDKLLVREIAIYQTQSSWDLMRGILRWANQTVLWGSIGLALLAGAIAYVSGRVTQSQTLLAFCIALVSLPIASLRSLRLAAMRGLHKIAIGLLPETLLAPLLVIALTATVDLILPERLVAPWVVGIYLISTTITFGIGARLLANCVPPQIRETIPKYQVRVWLRSAFPLMLLGGMLIINNRTDILMLGAIKGTEAVGIYVVCIRGAQLITFILMAVNTNLAPTAASLYAQGKLNELQGVITQCSRVVSVVSFLITVILIAASNWYLSLFGSEFIQGQNALIFLCIGSFVNATTGSVGVLLNMTGHEGYNAASVAASAILNVIGNALLIPRFGIDGAALTTASSTIFVNVVKVLWVRQKLGIDATAFGKIS